MTREEREVWVKRVERWRDSGLTAKAFAEQAGIGADRLRYWKWKLSRPESTRSDTSPPSSNSTALPFVEVTASEGVQHVGRLAEERLEILLPSGTRILIPTKFDEATLRRVVAVVA
jgi:transposase